MNNEKKNKIMKSVLLICALILAGFMFNFGYSIQLSTEGYWYYTSGFNGGAAGCGFLSGVCLIGFIIYDKF